MKINLSENYGADYFEDEIDDEVIDSAIDKHLEDYDEEHTDGEIEQQIADEIRDGKRMGYIDNYNYTEGESDTISWKLDFDNNGTPDESDYEEIADAIENGSATGVTSMSDIVWNLNFDGDDLEGGNSEDRRPMQKPLSITEANYNYTGFNRYPKMKSGDTEYPKYGRFNFEEIIDTYIETLADEYETEYMPSINYDSGSEEEIEAEEAIQDEFRNKIAEAKKAAFNAVKYQVDEYEAELAKEIDAVFAKAFDLPSAVSESKLSADEKKKLHPETFGAKYDGEEKYPLNDEEHVRSAISYFHKCPKDKQAGLAKKIVKAAKKFGIEISDKSKVMKALNESVFEIGNDTDKWALVVQTLPIFGSKMYVQLFDSKLDVLREIKLLVPNEIDDSNFQSLNSLPPYHKNYESTKVSDLTITNLSKLNSELELNRHSFSKNSPDPVTYDPNNPDHGNFDDYFKDTKK